jgi:hypothetical protein
VLIVAYAVAAVLAVVLVSAVRAPKPQPVRVRSERAIRIVRRD